MQTLEQQTETLSKEGVEKFVHDCLLEEGDGLDVVGCVDDRQPYGPDLPRYSIPGGGGGLLMIAFSALYFLDKNIARDKNKADKILEAVLEVLGGISKFRIHTDDDHQNGQIAAGCGHITNGMASPEAYGLTPEIAHIIKDQLNKLKKDGAVEDVLYGKHKAEAVIVAKGDLCLAHCNNEHGAFVYSETKAKELINKLSHILANKFGIDRESVSNSLNKALEMQLQATLDKLAFGLPLYKANQVNGIIAVN